MESMTERETMRSQLDKIARQSWKAFKLFGNSAPADRARLMREIAESLQDNEAQLIQKASSETNLSRPRLLNEFKRTLFQLRSYAEACEAGLWMELTIDRALPDRNPPRPDLRKMMIPIGPVVVFGASNFPFAYSTAGGDTACALAAGCSVIVKGHPAHPQTSSSVARIIREVIDRNGMPPEVFQHVERDSIETGTALVEHPLVKAVAFTGSKQGGRALFDLAAKRKEPIPVFAEMGSVNPVILLPGKLAASTDEIAGKLAASLLQSAGQFCTNPGLMIGMKSPSLEQFKSRFAEMLRESFPEKMLHKGIASNFHKNRAAVLEQNGVNLLAEIPKGNEDESHPGLARVDAKEFISNPTLHQEVFGPFSLLVECNSPEELMQVCESLEGQLTMSLFATNTELFECFQLVTTLREKAGRMIFNGVPTGVEVALSMQHGGPYPATTDSRFTAVGADGIRRFIRPVCFQNWPDELLPEPLRNVNIFKRWRRVDGHFSNSNI